MLQLSSVKSFERPYHRTVCAVWGVRGEVNTIIYPLFRSAYFAATTVARPPTSRLIGVSLGFRRSDWHLGPGCWQVKSLFHCLRWPIRLWRFRIFCRGRSDIAACTDATAKHVRHDACLEGVGGCPIQTSDEHIDEHAGDKREHANEVAVANRWAATSSTERHVPDDDSGKVQ